MSTKLTYLIFCIISGFLLSLAFPGAEIWWISFFAITPFMYIIWFSEIKSYRLIFLLSYVFFFTFFIFSLFWIRHVSIPGLLSLTLFLALLSAIVITIGKYISVKIKIAWWIISSISWLSIEFIFSYFLGGFPWTLLGYALAPYLPLCQIADIFGVHGISLLVIYINCAFAYVIKNYAEIENYAFIPVGFGITFLAITWVYGNHHLTNKIVNDPENNLRIAFIQPNIEPKIKHDSSKDRSSINKIINLSKQAANSSPDLLIWPESAIPGYLQNYNISYYSISNFFNKYNIPILSGITRYYDDYSIKKRLYYNSAAVLYPPMLIKEIYDKEHLVAFGEFIPLEKYLPFLKLATPISGSFSRGQSNTVYNFKYKDKFTAHLGILICFEDVFPSLAIKMVKRGANLLVNLTNDGWFGKIQPKQHSRIAMFRAIETRTPLIRSTNTGISSVFDRTGKVIKELSKDGKNVDILGYLPVDIPLQAPAKTFYMLCKDFLAAISFFSLIILIIPAYKKNNSY